MNTFKRCSRFKRTCFTLQPTFHTMSSIPSLASFLKSNFTGTTIESRIWRRFITTFSKGLLTSLLACFSYYYGRKAMLLRLLFQYNALLLWRRSLTYQEALHVLGFALAPPPAQPFPFLIMLSWLTIREFMMILRLMTMRRMRRLTWKGINLMETSFTGTKTTSTRMDFERL